MVVTEYRNLYDVNNVRIVDYNWFDFIRRRIENPSVFADISWDYYQKLQKDLTREQKSNKEWNIETKQRIKTLGGGAVFGRLIIPEGETKMGRGKKYFPKRSAVCFDFEGCSELIYMRIADALKDVTFAYHSTCSNRPDDVRLHCIIPFAYEVDWQLYTLCAIDLAKKIGEDGLDKSCINRAQMELYPVKLMDNEYKHCVHNVMNGNDVVFLDVENYIKTNYGSLDVKEVVAKMDINLSEWCCELAKSIKAKKTIVCDGKKIEYVSKFIPKKAVQFDVKSCFNAVWSCWNILDMLPDYERTSNDRYTYRYATGSNGVWVSNDGYWCGSYHSDSGDKLHERSGNTAIDVWMMFNCNKDASYREKLAAAHCWAKKNQRYYELFYGGM